MSREVRRVPMGWQHPMEWRERWDRSRGAVRATCVPRPLFADFPGSLARWEEEGRELEQRRGFDWDFYSKDCLLDGQPFDSYDDDEVPVRDADHLHELLTARHHASRPDPDNYMPVFDPAEALGWCMYETTTEGTPISPVLDGPEALARWLADNHASTFGDMTASYEQWLQMIVGTGWAPSAVGTGGGLLSGVEFIARGEGSTATGGAS